MIYEAVKADRGNLSVAAACTTLGVSRDAYYHWLKHGRTPKDETGLVSRMEAIILEFPGYGYRRVTAELRRRGTFVNHKRVLKLMRTAHLIKRRRRRFVVTTDSNHGQPVYPNLAKKIITSDINQLWVADISYIRLRSQFVYLAVILDAYSRKAVGWSLKANLSQELSLSALRQALATRNLCPGLVHHSDRGVHYACGDYIQLLRRHGISVSMSAIGNPYDNAKAESFMATLKKEEVYLSDYDNLADARNSIGLFIEDVYNTKRLHSALGYLPPAEFESKLTGESQFIEVS